MATITFHTYGQIGLHKAQCVISTDTWSLITTYFSNDTYNQLVLSPDGSYYAAIASTLYKYNSNFTIDTTWGTSGKAYITTAYAVNTNAFHQMAVNSNNYLAAVVSIAAAGSAINCWCFNSAGISVWARSTITTLGSPVRIETLPNGNFVLGGAAGTIVGLREYDYGSGTYVRNYPAISMAWHYGLTVNSAGDIFDIGNNAGLSCAIAYKFYAGNTVPVWTQALNTMAEVNSAAANSLYVFIHGITDDWNDGKVLVLNKATGIKKSGAFISNFYYPQPISATTIPNNYLLGPDYTWPDVLYRYQIYDENSVIIAEITAATVGFITAPIRGLVGRPQSPGFNIQSPRVLTYSRKLLAFANNQIWAEVTA